jgi:integrase
MKVRARGSIRQRSKDSWTLTLYLGRDAETGKDLRRYRTVAGTRDDAERAMAEMILQATPGRAPAPETMTVAELLERWLAVKNGNVAPRTLTRYRELQRLHLVPVIGAIQVKKLQPLDVERVYARARDRGLSPTTVCRIHRVLFMALKRAVQWQITARNVAEAVEPPTPARHRREALSVPQVNKLLQSIGDSDLQPLTILGIGTGLRLGECLGLRWADIDFDNEQLSVNQTLQIDMTFSQPKTHRSGRVVALPSFVVEMLKAHKSAQNERRLLCGTAWADIDLVFDRGDGRPLRTDTTSKRFARAARAVGLDLTFHGLRHGHASLMLASGVDLKVTSQRLGHSSISITSDLYTHVSSKLDRAAADSLNELFRSAR